MRNTLLILLAVLMMAAGALAMFSSSGEYAAEKLFFQAMQTQKQIAANPDVAPQAMLDAAEKKLRRIGQRYPQTEAARVSYLALAEFYLGRRDYAQAHASVDKAIELYGQDKAALSRARFLKGIIFEAQDLWEQALGEFRLLRDEYSDTPLGLSALLYIGSHYTRKGMLAEAAQAYNEAAQFYDKLGNKHKGQPLGYAAANLLLQAYVTLRQYEQAGQTLEDILNTYPQPSVFGQQMPNIDLIFIKFLKNNEKAIELYTNIKERVREPELKKALQQRIEALKVEK